MRFGLSGFPLGQMGFRLAEGPAETLTALARAADECGFDFIAAQDHTLAPREWAGSGGGETWFEPFVVLGWAAGLTRRVRLLTDVVVLPYRPPFAVAKIAASLDALSGGRLILGVAAGYLEREFRILGAPFEERGAVADEAIEVIKRCWTEEWMSFSGKYFAASDVAISPRPAQQPRPPIWVGGNSLRALRRAVEHADGWTPFLGDPAKIASSLAHARSRFGLEAGRAFDVCVPLRRGVYTEDRSALDVDSILRQVEELAGIGVTHTKVAFRGPAVADYRRAMEQFASAVLPRFH